MAEKLHPSIDKGLPKKSARFKGGTLVCACVTNPVEVEITGQVAHNHACGCTKCWKPEGALFSVVEEARRDEERENAPVQETGWRP